VYERLLKAPIKNLLWGKITTQETGHYKLMIMEPSAAFWLKAKV